MNRPAPTRRWIILLGALLGPAALATAPTPAEGQLVPVRAEQGRGVELTFPTPRHLNLATPEPLARGEFHYSIMHTFGEAKDGAGTFWGLDSGANVRFSMEYGLTDRSSLLLGRSSMDRVYEMGARTLLLAQGADGSPPVSVALHVAGGIMTLDEAILGESATLQERTHLSAALPVALGRDRFSLLVVPMVASFDRSFAFQSLATAQDTRFLGLGLGARLQQGQVVSLTAQLLPTRGLSSGEVRTVAGVGVDLDTGGHVFQLWATNTRALNDAYVLAAPVGDIGDGAIRFAFNVNRSFQLF